MAPAKVHINTGQARYRKNLSQQKLAELADLAVAFVQRIEYGTSGCSLSTLLQLARVLERLNLSLGDEKFTLLHHSVRPHEPVPLDQITDNAIGVLVRLAQELHEGADAIVGSVPDLVNAIDRAGDATKELADVWEQAVADVRTAIYAAEERMMAIRPDVVRLGERQHRDKVVGRGYTSRRMGRSAA